MSLLEEMYGQVIIPEAVARELSAAHPELLVQSMAGFIDVRFVDTSAVQRLTTSFPTLDRGELEALTLAAGEDSALLIVDEVAARGVADQLRIRKIGVLGILRTAKARGLIGPIAPVAKAMMGAGFRIDAGLLARVLRSVGE